MSQERTISLIKPDAFAKNIVGEIYSRFEKAEMAFFFSDDEICPRLR